MKLYTDTFIRTKDMEINSLNGLGIKIKNRVNINKRSILVDITNKVFDVGRMIQLNLVVLSKDDFIILNI